ncbi:ABC transporter ATP-binding protein [Ruegeria sp. MALMAid1280]
MRPSEPYQQRVIQGPRTLCQTQAALPIQMRDESLTPAIQAIDICKSYPGSPPVEALKNESLSINDNEFFTLLGPSGCGKTTLLRLIAGFEDLTSGELRLYGEDISSMPPEKRPINTVFQHYALFPHMAVVENVAFGLRRRETDVAQAQKTALEILDLVQMSQFANRRPSQWCCQTNSNQSQLSQ